MRVDFIHIGYHKTASTFLQTEVFSRVDGLIGLNLLDVEMDQWFFNNFINVNSHAFNRDSFKNSFMTMVSERIQDNTDSHVCAISDENLSGDIYTGLESRELMNRLYSVFGTTKILIVIRNQIDIVLSTYSDYILVGGTRGVKQWLTGHETKYGLLLEKIKYSSLIEDYMTVFGRENVHVVQHEKLFDDVDGIGFFLSLNGLKLPQVREKRINPGRSLNSNLMMAYLNRVGLGNLKGSQRIFSLLKGGCSDRESVKSLICNELKEIYADNRKVECLIGSRLTKEYYE